LVDRSYPSSGKLAKTIHCWVPIAINGLSSSLGRAKDIRGQQSQIAE
jgi:hypothetical protein